MIGRQVDVEVALGGVVERISFEYLAPVAVDDDPAVVAQRRLLPQMAGPINRNWQAFVSALFTYLQERLSHAVNA